MINIEVMLTGTYPDTIITIILERVISVMLECDWTNIFDATWLTIHDEAP